MRYVVVVLPEPDGPDERHELAGRGLEVDPLEREPDRRGRGRRGFRVALAGAVGRERVRRGREIRPDREARLGLHLERRPDDRRRLGRRPLHRLAVADHRRPDRLVLLERAVDGGESRVLARRAVGAVRRGRRLGRDRPGRVGEGDVAEAQPPADRARVDGDRVRGVHDLRVEVQVLEDPVEERERAGDLHVDREQLAEREEEAALERRERDDVADRRGVAGSLIVR